MIHERDAYLIPKKNIVLNSFLCYFMSIGVPKVPFRNLEEVQLDPLRQKSLFEILKRCN